MSIVIELAPDEEARLEKKAARRGQDAVAYALSLVRHDLSQEEQAGDERERRLEALALIQSGYFAKAGSSSEEFAARKAEEIALEERRWNTWAEQSETA